MFSEDKPLRPFFLNILILCTKVSSLFCVFGCTSHGMLPLHTLCVWLEVKAKGKIIIIFFFLNGVWKRALLRTSWLIDSTVLANIFFLLLLWYLTNIIGPIFHDTLDRIFFLWKIITALKLMNKRTIIPYMSRFFLDIWLPLSSKSGTLSSRTQQSIRFYCSIQWYSTQALSTASHSSIAFKNFFHPEPGKISVGS